MTDDILELNHQGKLVAYYRKQHNLSRAKLAEMLDVDVSTVYRMEQQGVIKDIKRRQLLVGLLGIPTALLPLEELKKQSTPSLMTVNEDHMAFFEYQLAARWDVYHTGGTTRASQGLNVWLREISSFAQEYHGNAWQERANVSLCMSYQLQGSIYRDLMNYDHAKADYTKAFQIAHELNNQELMASALARTGVTYIQKQEPLQALSYLNEALKVVDRVGLPSLRGYILQALSEAYAMAKLSKESVRSVELAERTLERKGTVIERSYCQPNTTSVVAQRGVNSVLLQDNERAIALIDKALIYYDPTLVRGRARLIAQKAEAYFGLDMVDNCVSTAEDALQMAYSVGSNKTIMRIKLLYTSLSQSRWRKERSVVHLGTLLTTNL